MITRIPNGMEDEILFFMKSVDDYIGHIIGLRQVTYDHGIFFA
jgi:hypothetical protein